MTLELKMDPPTTTAQMHKVTTKNGKPIFYDPPAVKEAKQKIMSYLAKYRLKEPLEGPISLSVSWLYAAGPRHKHGEYRIQKPDTDNLQKMLKDCMTLLGFWKDDAQVAVEVIQKMWVKSIPGIYIELEQIGETDEQ